MFRPMRRKKNEICEEAARELLKTARRGVLSVIGDDGYPYGIPINYWYDEERGRIYFHGAKVGHKVDAIKACDKVCFTVYGNETVKDEAWAPYLQSVVIFGRCCLLTEPDEILANLKAFATKYFPSETMVNEEAARSEKTVQMFEITIEHMSGKEVQEK